MAYRLLTVVAALVVACTPLPSRARLTMDATGLGSCTVQWYMSCNYGIRVEGPGGYDHRGNFAWDPGPVEAGQELRVTNGPMASTGVLGDVPPTLGPGVWTVSFRRWYGSDAIQLRPVPGGTPRLAEEDPFIAACRRPSTPPACRASPFTSHSGAAPARS